MLHALVQSPDAFSVPRFSRRHLPFTGKTFTLLSRRNNGPRIQIKNGPSNLLRFENLINFLLYLIEFYKKNIPYRDMEAGKTKNNS